MDTLEVALGARSYRIFIGSGLLSNADLLASAVTGRQVLIVTNTTVAPLYLDQLQRGLDCEDQRVHVLPDGEQYKTLQTFSEIIDTLIEARFHRDACLVALGGGVVGDVAGFAAACYQRGIRFVQIPTTLLAQVDSGVGGKTAVNHPQAKNMIGAFYQPSAVIADTDTLSTLPRREFSAGLAEVIKYGLILDAEFFAWLEAHLDEVLALDADALRIIIGKSCELKAAIVAEDEHERGRRALLNLGHTFGHALESIGNYERWLHGEAVSIGMVLAARTSAALGLLEQDVVARIAALLSRAGLPTDATDVDTERVLEIMQLDKKTTAKGLSLVLLEGIGNGVIAPAPSTDVLRTALESGHED
ncbi:MAG: 3-dehydroquinate synthase [Gammaproteobacteria bacterium]|nr:3-dehydroquinate synthase [Gammaproteobacteria bacterium]